MVRALLDSSESQVQTYSDADALLLLAQHRAQGKIAQHELIWELCGLRGTVLWLINRRHL